MSRHVPDPITIPGEEQRPLRSRLFLAALVLGVIAAFGGLWSQ